MHHRVLLVLEVDGEVVEGGHVELERGGIIGTLILLDSLANQVDGLLANGEAAAELAAAHGGEKASGRAEGAGEKTTEDVVPPVF